MKLDFLNRSKEVPPKTFYPDQTIVLPSGTVTLKRADHGKELDFAVLTLTHISKLVQIMRDSLVSDFQ